MFSRFLYRPFWQLEVPQLIAMPYHPTYVAFTTNQKRGKPRRGGNLDMTSTFSIVVYYISACWGRKIQHDARTPNEEAFLSMKRVFTRASFDPETVGLLSETRNSTTASWASDPSVNTWIPLWDNLDDKVKVARSDDSVQTLEEIRNLTLPVLSNSRTKKRTPSEDESGYIAGNDQRRHQLILEHRRDLLKERNRAVQRITKIDETLSII
jgi:hypothetical protein